MTTDIQAIDALAQAIADAEMRAGRNIAEDEAMAVARALCERAKADALFVSSMAHHIRYYAEDIRFARAAYAAGRASAEERVAELEAALKPFAREAEEWGGNLPNDLVPEIRNVTPSSDDIAARFTLGDLRRARAALKGGSHE